MCCLRGGNSERNMLLRSTCRRVPLGNVWQLKKFLAGRHPAREGTVHWLRTVLALDELAQFEGLDADPWLTWDAGDGAAGSSAESCCAAEALAMTRSS